MRTSVCAIVAAIAATGLAAHPAFAQANRTAMKFWHSVQVTCNTTAAKAPTELGRRIAQTAIDEFTRFGGHQIDSDGRLFHFGLTEASLRIPHHCFHKPAPGLTNQTCGRPHGVNTI